MNYAQLRFKIYVDDCKQLLAIISRLGVFIAAVCYQVVIPVFLTFVVFGVAQIADDDTTYRERVVYQGIYFVCIYGLIRVQRAGILASHYQSYLNGLPVEPWRVWLQNSKLCLYAGNLLFIAPIGLCLFIPSMKVLIETLYFVLFSLMMVLMSQLAIYRQNVPWFSLILFPCCVFFADFSANTMNWLWFTLVGMELAFIDKLPRGWFMPPVRHYLMWLLLYGKSRSASVITRQVLVMGFLAIHAYMVMERPDFDTVIFAQIVNTLTGLVLGSYQFEIERFRHGYRDYFATLLLSNRYLRVVEGCYLILIAVLTSILCSMWLGFSLWLVVQLNLIIGATAFGVIYLNKYYFVVTLLVAGILMAI